MAYNFSQLSSLDFEDLCRDLLQAEMGESLETFKPGRDQGIDIRGLYDKKKTIIQCKHYIKSGISSLLSKLKKEESDKVKKLSPDRYLFCTSLPLSPMDKEKIKSIFNPFIQSKADIFGQEDLNNLLNKHKEIETQHFKLWLSSTVVLDKVLNNAVLTRSGYLVKRVIKKLPLYVPNASLNEVLKTLKDQRIAIITGEPGVGKTTLAEMAIYQYLSKDHRVIEVNSPRDAYDLYNPETPTIYYFDDFLGLTYLGDRFNEKEETEILHLIDLVKNSKNARMVLTSREYILNQASLNSERFENSDFLHFKYRLEISSYTKIIKAKILYNHLFFSKLSDEYIEEIITTKAYNSIIQHQNYSPRILEWMTDKSFVEGVSQKDYPEFFLETLNHPKRLWEKPFTKQISDSARHLLLVLLTLGGNADSAKLQRAFEAYHSFACKKFHLKIGFSDFSSASKELLGGFLGTKDNLMEFTNPSLKDFLELWVSENKNVIDDLFAGATSLKQCQTIWGLCVSHPEYEPTILEIGENIISNIYRLNDRKPYILKKLKVGEKLLVNDLTYAERFGLYLKIYKIIPNSDLLKIIDATLDSALSAEIFAKGFLENWVKLGLIVLKLHEKKLFPNDTLEKYKSIIVSFIKKNFGIDDFYFFIRALQENLIDNSHKKEIREELLTFLEHEIETEIGDYNSAHQLDEYMSKFEKVMEYFQVDGYIFTSWMEEVLEELQATEANYEDHAEDEWRERYYFETDEQRFIDECFQNLEGR